VNVVIQTEAPPIRQDESGALRVGDSRVLLEMVIQEFREGATPEMIVQQYDTLALPDVYAVIGYYLRHREEIQAYLDQREHCGREVQRRVEESQRDLGDIRRRLLAARPA
jgi:uncharacterized protein (DUF433 family)